MLGLLIFNFLYSRTINHFMFSNLLVISMNYWMCHSRSQYSSSLAMYNNIHCIPPNMNSLPISSIFTILIYFAKCFAKFTKCFAKFREALREFHEALRQISRSASRNIKTFNLSNYVDILKNFIFTKNQTLYLCKELHSSTCLEIWVDLQQLLHKLNLFRPPF